MFYCFIFQHCYWATLCSRRRGYYVVCVPRVYYLIGDLVLYFVIAACFMLIALRFLIGIDLVLLAERGRLESAAIYGTVSVFLAVAGLFAGLRLIRWIVV